jgi:hypothetical protein
MSMVIIGSKLLLVSSYSSIAPFYDQWDAQANLLYENYLGDRFRISIFGIPHNEHHLVFTYVLSLVMLELTGIWDPQVEMIFNVFLHVLAMGVFCFHATKPVSRLSARVLIPVFTVILAIPFGWMNALWGFQSQFYFVVLFTLLALAWCVGHPVFSRRWLAGMGFAVAAIFTTASGALVFPVLMGNTLLRLVWGRERRGMGLSAAALQLGLFLWALWIIPPTPHHDVLKAASVSQFIETLCRVLSWPHACAWWTAVAVWLPSAALAWYMFRRRFADGDASLLLLSISAWVGLQAVALAYGRSSDPLSSRYLDVLILGVLTNGLAAVVLLERVVTTKVRSIGVMSVFAYLAWIGVDSGLVMAQEMTFVRVFSEKGRLQTQHVKGFMESGDTTFLYGKSHLEIPYPEAEKLVVFLRNPLIRGLLPGPLGSTEAERAHCRERTLLKGRMYGVVQRVKRMLLASSSYLLLVSYIGFSVFAIRQSRQPVDGS